MKPDPAKRAEDLQSAIVVCLFLAVVLALSVNMLGGGWLWATVVFLGVNGCGWLLARRVERYYDRIDKGDDRPS